MKTKRVILLRRQIRATNTLCGTVHDSCPFNPGHDVWCDLFATHLLLDRRWFSPKRTEACLEAEERAAK